MDSFNAAYSDGGDLDGEQLNERQRFRGFVAKLLEGDHDDLLYRAVWRDEARPICLFVENRYVYSPFWKFQHGRGGIDWETSFESGKIVFDEALHGGDTATVPSFLFDRLYMLRNQLIHGGATWNSSVNREQLESGVRSLGAILPAMADIMMTYPLEEWGRPFFPVIEETS